MLQFGRDLGGAGLRIPQAELFQVQPGTVLHAADEILAGRGLAVVAVDPAEGVSDEELGAHLDETALPALLENSPIASMVSWRYIQMGEGTEQAPMDLGAHSV